MTIRSPDTDALAQEAEELRQRAAIAESRVHVRAPATREAKFVMVCIWLTLTGMETRILHVPIIFCTCVCHLNLLRESETLHLGLNTLEWILRLGVGCGFCDFDYNTCIWDWSQTLVSATLDLRLGVGYRL